MTVLTPEQFGAIGNWGQTGAHDDLPAFAAMMAAAKHGDKIEIGPKKYYLNGTLTIDKEITIQGPSGQQNAGLGLFFSPMFTGIIVNSANVCLFDLGCYTISLPTKNVTANGLESKFRMYMERCRFSYFPQDGVHLDSSGGNSGDSWQLSACVFTSNGRHGLYVRGGDSNAGIAINCRASNNGFSGLVDDSFLGNVWIGCAAHSNKQYGMWSTGAGRNQRALWLGCYIELDNPAQIELPSMWMGWASVNGSGASLAPDGAGMKLHNHLTVYGDQKVNPLDVNGPKLPAVYGRLGHASGDRVAFEMGTDGKLSWRWQRDINSLPGYWAFAQGGMVGNTAMLVSDVEAVEGPGKLFLPWEYYRGIGFLRMRSGMGATPPVKVTDPAKPDWKVGDEFIAKTPQPGQPERWRCTARAPDGTLTWKVCARLEA